MIWNLETSWLIMVVGSVAVMAFFFGSALHSIMREDGFGPFGNMFIFVIGFFGAIYLANRFGISLRDLTRATSTGLGGAFVLIAVLAVFKAGVARFAR